MLISLSAGSQTRAELIAKKGLYITSQGLNWAMGSEINFFTADKKHHHYYFTWWEQDAEYPAPGQTRLLIGSDNTAVSGRYELSREEKQIQTRIHCQWNRTDSGRAQLVYSRLWWPYLHSARWENEIGQPINDWTSFRGRQLTLHVPFGSFRFAADHPFRARLEQDSTPGPGAYTARSQYLVFFEDDIPVSGGKNLERQFGVEILEEPSVITGYEKIGQVEPVPIRKAWDPSPAPLTVLPRPQKMELTGGYFTLTGSFTGTEKSTDREFREILKTYWQTGPRLSLNLQQTTDNTLPEEGYRLRISEQGIEVRSKTRAGYQHSLHTLAQLVQPAGGQLQIPCGTIEDAPATGWRGIHMFTGPTAWPLHRRMYENVLLPLKMNKTVIQCEQARWKSFPAIHNPISVSLADLKKEFTYLRSRGVEPIPLIQSLGHMEWFFKPASTRHLAVNPAYPYTLNTTLPAARTAIQKIWEEADALLQPAVVHVGFDEIGMIGFHWPREKEVELFRDQLAFLQQWAAKKRKTLMLWGDMGLAPGEAPDACNGVNPERAAQIRAAIPKNAWVADWHYLNNPDPEVYRRNLQLWKNNGQRPLASPWLWPGNVRGFVKAAVAEKAGVLQTTWADFESSETNMLKNIEQFGAYVLALDYAWSNRDELPSQLPYDPVTEWSTRFYRDPRPVQEKEGWNIPVPADWRNCTRQSSRKEYSAAELRFTTLSWTGIRIKARTAVILPEATPVLRLRFFEGEKQVYEKTLRYGAEIRALTDARPVYAHSPGQDRHTHYTFLNEKGFRANRVKIELLHPGAGLQLEEFILIKP